MERNTNLSTVMFPVELRPIGFQSGTSETGDEDSCQESSSAFEAIDKYQAIVRVDTGTVFAVVTSRYELLHNSRALDLGTKAFQLFFPEAEASDFIPYDIQLTKTGSACHIDLIHKGYDTKVWEQEIWLPFLRVSNSYNRSRALTFDFGFVRELCSNGLIFRRESIQAKFYHTKGELNIDLAQDEKFQKLKDLEAEFSAHTTRLREIKITRDRINALSLHLLGLSFDVRADDPKRRESERERLDSVAEKLDEMISTYIDDLGPNAYTALNASTDFATHAPTVAGNFASSSSLQQEIGQRMTAVSDASGDDPNLEGLLQLELGLLQSA